MLDKKTRGIATALAVTCTTIAAAAPPVVIDSEQKANAAVLAALRIRNTPMGHLHFISNAARGYLEEALNPLAAATTPAGLMNARNGVTLPCADGGNLTARMARTFPRVLKLSWTACKFTDSDGYPRERAGAAEILLLSDSFTPEKVGAIRFGTATADFVDKRHVDDVDQITDETRSLNVRMAGLIPMRRAFPPRALFVGDFAYETTGFYVEHQHVELPAIPVPPFDSEFRLMPDHLVASGNITYSNSNTHSVEQARFHFGKVTTLDRVDGYPDSTFGYTVDGFNYRREFDQPSATSTERADGRFEIQYPASDVYAAGCLSGAYTLKTRAPLVRNFASPYEIDSGDLLVNGSTIAQFYTAATVPAGLPVPTNHNLVHLEAKDVGTFNYDTNGRAMLYENAQCWY